MLERRHFVRWGAVAWLAVGALGCGNEVVVFGGNEPADACTGAKGEGCDAEVAGQCVGAAAARSCGPEACECATIQPAADGASLQSALAAASPGTCIELTGSSYGDFDVPEGVRVLARGTSLAEVGAVTMTSDAALCGLNVRGGITVGVGARGVDIRNVRVEGAPENGVLFDEGAGGRVVDTTIVRSAQVGLLLALSADVTVERTAILEAEYFGMAGTCGECGCPEAPPFTVKMRRLAAERNRVAGLWFEGVEVQAEGVAIRDTKVGADFGYGSGLTMRCGELVMQGLTIEGSADYGMGFFETDASVQAGDLGDVRITDNLFGIWAVNVGAQTSSLASVSDADIADNRGAGVAIGGVVGGGVVELTDSVVRGTRNIAIPVLVNGVSAGSEEVGDGILWMDAVEVELSNVELSDNERASLLINGAAAGSLGDVQFSGGDSGDVPLLQNYVGGPEPAVTGATPSLEVTSEEVYPVPLSPVQSD
jgi:hypothetical protein